MENNDNNNSNKIITQKKKKKKKLGYIDDDLGKTHKGNRFNNPTTTCVQRKFWNVE